MAKATFKVCENCRAKNSSRARKCKSPFCRGTVFRAPTCEEIKEENKWTEQFERMIEQANNKPNGGKAAA